jgi:ABC-type branched-subunit amino acid transport system substrate-binding protein
MLPIIHQTSTPVLSQATTDAALYPKPIANVFMPFVSARQQADAIVAGMTQRLGGSLKGKKIAYVGLSVPYIDDMLAEVKQKVSAAGGSIGQVERFAFGTQSFATQAASIASSKPDGVLDTGTAPDTVLAVKAMLSAGIKVPLVSYAAGSDVSTLKAINSAQYSALAVAVPPVAGTDINTAATNLGFGDKTTGNFFSIGWGQAALLVTGLQKCGATCSPSQLTAALQEVGTVDVASGALYGPMSVSADNHAALSKGQFLTWDDASSKSVNQGDPVSLS